jgi:hypothetical protein
MSLLQLVVAAGLVGLQMWAVTILVPLTGMSRSMLGISLIIAAVLALLEFYSILTVMPSI